jgi:hypothetical protein
MEAWEPAGKQLGDELKRRDAIVQFAYCPDGSGINGPDDAIFKFGPEWGLKTIRDAWVAEEIKVDVEPASRPALRSSELPGLYKSQLRWLSARSRR